MYGNLVGMETLYLNVYGICGMGLHFMLDGFRCVYCVIAVLMWVATAVFSRQYFEHYKNRGRFYLFFVMTFFATIGVFLSADLFSVFIFFEIMSFTSFVWVAHDETPEAMKAAYTYLSVAVIGGLVTLMGMFMLYNEIGTLMLSEIPAAMPISDQYLIGALLAFGFMAKAGVWPLHIWLPKAHPIAPAPASALLSGILTKTGIFGILAVTCNMFAHDAKWGRAIMYLGAVTMFTGALLALFSLNLKRTLACSSVSQIGFIMVGIGAYSLSEEIEETVIATRGIMLHMVNHSLIKLVLFMAAGVIYMNLHKLDLNELRGYGRRKPLLKICFAIGALSISGIPLFSGYISKTLLHEAIGDRFIEWLFLISGGMTLGYMLKLFITIFVEKNNDEKIQNTYDESGEYWNIPSRLAVTIPAGILLILGLLPYLTMNRIAQLSAGFFGISAEESAEAAVSYFSFENLKGSLISIAIGIVLYLFIIRVPHGLFCRAGEDGRTEYVNRWPAWLDLEDSVYRPLILKILPGIVGFVCAVAGEITDMVIIILRRTLHRQISTHIETGSLDDHLAVETGKVLDKCFPKKDGSSYIPALVEREEYQARTQRVIYSSLSFGLILVCVGLILVLIYTLASA